MRLPPRLDRRAAKGPATAAVCATAVTDGAANSSRANSVRVTNFMGISLAIILSLRGSISIDLRGKGGV